MNIKFSTAMMVTKKTILQFFSLFMPGLILLMSFQNCAPTEFYMDQRYLDSLAVAAEIEGISGGHYDTTVDLKATHLESSPKIYFSIKNIYQPLVKVQIMNDLKEIICEAETHSSSEIQFDSQCKLDDDLSEIIVYLQAEGIDINSETTKTETSAKILIYNKGPFISIGQSEFDKDKLIFKFNFSVAKKDPNLEIDSNSYRCRIYDSLTGQIPSFERCNTFFEHSKHFVESGASYTFEIEVSDLYGNLTTAKKSAQTGLLNSSPALAIQAIGCISCHAQVKSDFVTDLGINYPLFMNQTASVRSYNGYSDHNLSHYSSIDYIKGNLILLNKAFPRPTDLYSNDINEFLNSTEFADKSPAEKSLINQLATHGKGDNATASSYFGIINDYKKATNQSLYNIKNVSEMLIASPTADQIIRASGNKITQLGTSHFISSSSRGSQITGLKKIENSIFALSGDSQCEGDLFINGSLIIQKAKIITDTGCRIYTTGPVFFRGQLLYDDPNKVGGVNNANLQVSSSNAISMGIGPAHCEDKADQKTHVWFRLAGHNQTPINLRYSHYLIDDRQKIIGEETMQAATKINNLGTEFKVVDATCENELINSELAFERLLLNSPNIQSRYVGDVKGMVIAEYALFSVGNFHFEFDPVFARVKLLPSLDFNNNILKIR